MAITPHRGRPAEHVSFQYRAMRGIVEQVRGRVPGKLEITEEGLVHDLASPGGTARVDGGAGQPAVGEGHAGGVARPHRHT